jgi:hypothetical protein
MRAGRSNLTASESDLTAPSAPLAAMVSEEVARMAMSTRPGARPSSSWPPDGQPAGVR